MSFISKCEAIRVQSLSGSFGIRRLPGRAFRDASYSGLGMPRLPDMRYSSSAATQLRLRRCMLYVPGSFEPVKLSKTLHTTKSDSVCFDLEDSVAKTQKAKARDNLAQLLNHKDSQLPKEKLVRINSTNTEYWQADLKAVAHATNLDGILIPKVNSAKDIQMVESMLSERNSPKDVCLIASIESAIAVMNLKEIATASSRLSALLFAAEDYCADVGIHRSKSRLEMLYARSAVVTAAKAHKLQAIDLVCVALRDNSVLRQESEEGCRLGYNAKQAIHPGQVDMIQSIFGPSDAAIKRAANIIKQDAEMQNAGKGAFSYTEEDGSETMIDAPMLLQAQAVMQQAKQAGWPIPR